MKKHWLFAGLVASLSIVGMLRAQTPAPMQNYCPVVIVNNTGQGASDVYFVATALDPNGIFCFLVPDTNGVCSYQYPNPDGTNGSVASSVTLSELPQATGTGISGSAYLFYFPICSSGRAYFSINNPMILSTTYSSGSGSCVINGPSVVSLNDPNYYTFYQDFEFGFIESQTDSSTKIYINLTWVDYFCLPMKLYANSYQGQGADPTINNSVSPISGMPSGSTQKSIMQTTMSKLSTYATTWGYLPVYYYPSPYTSTTGNTPIRILAAKNSTDLTTGRQFNGPKSGSGINNCFPSDYVTDSSTGPQASVSYMEAVYNHYLSDTLYTIITPANGHILYKVYSDSGIAGQLNFDAYQPGTTTAIPADNTTLDLYTLPLDQLLSGGVNTFVNNSFPNNTPIGAELGKLVSALFSIGQLPFTAFTTSVSTPFYNAADYVSDDQNYGYINLSFFSNPPGYTLNGPWYNYYDQVLHTQMLGTGTVNDNPSLGVAYAYDYDDLLNMSGIINGLYIQDAYGQPSQVTGASNPYIVMELESLAGSTIPSLSDSYYYSVTLGAATAGAQVSFAYYNGSSTQTVSPGGSISSLYGQNFIPGTTDYLQATFVFNGVTYKCNINLLGQVVTPINATPSFSGAYQQYQGNFTFTVTAGHAGSVGDPIPVTINFNSAATPWGG